MNINTFTPCLGDWMVASDRLQRVADYNPSRYKGWDKLWKRYAEAYPFKRNPSPVTGIYIGKRTYSNGSVGSPVDGCPYEPKEYFEVWLIVPGQRSKPIPVLPEDCRYTQASTFRRAN